MATEWCEFCGKKLPKEDMDNLSDDGRYGIEIQDTIEDETNDGFLCKVCYQFVRQMLR